MKLFKNVHYSWVPLLHSLAYKEPLESFLKSLDELSYEPKFEDIFKVFEMPVKDIKVVILGQEPYPLPGVANGKAYAVSQGSEITRILKNVKQEVYNTEKEIIAEGDRMVISKKSSYEEQKFMKNKKWNSLEHLSKQGVFLLNTSLTVETNKAGSHLAHWRDFTETVISFISKVNPCIWMLWGRNALSYSGRIYNPFIVKGYDRETIEEIPLDPKVNYVIPGNHPVSNELEGISNFSEDGFHHANVILKNKEFLTINW